MHHLNEAIRAGSIEPKPRSVRRLCGGRPLPAARDLMSTHVITLRTDQRLWEAVRILARNPISGAPVLSPDGELAGILSEFDCMRVIADAEFHQASSVGNQSVADVMTPARHVVPPNADLFALCQQFVSARVHRLPVLDEGELVGFVTRRDVIRAIAALWPK